MLIHKRELKAYAQMAERVSEESLQQLWDHLAQTPYKRPDINAGRKLRGPKFAALPDGTSAVAHYRIGSADRVDYRYHDAWTGGAQGDPHPVVFIVTCTGASPARSARSREPGGSSRYAGGKC